MSDKNNIFENDLLMRSILEGGQEEVPGHVWDAVSQRLDEAESLKKRRTVALWWRRAGVAVAAAAAVVAAIVMVNPDKDAVDIVPASVHGDMIAVVEPETPAIEETVVSQTSGAELLAYVPELPIKKSDEDIVEENEVTDFITEDQAEVIADVTVEEVIDNKSDIDETVKAEDRAYVSNEYPSYQTDWEEDVPARKVKTAFVISGLTGASKTNSNTGSGPLKAPSVILTPTETGIREKENQNQYGIPISVGAGVRFEFSPRWSLGVGLNYTSLSRRLQGTYTHVNESGSIDDLITSEIKNTQHYIGLPIHAYFTILDSKQINFYTYAGGTVEKCLSNKYHVLTGDIMHKEAVSGVQLSAAVGLGAEFMLTQHAGLYIDPSLRYYFDCDQPKSIRTAQPLTLGLEIGLRFKL